MAYISIAEVAEIRKQLKEDLPDYKFSVRRNDSLSVIVTAIRGKPLNDILSEKNVQVNGFAYVQTHKPDRYPNDKDWVIKVVDIIRNAPAKASGREYYEEWCEIDQKVRVPFYFDLRVGS